MRERANHSAEYRVITLGIGLLASFGAACASTSSPEESARSIHSARLLEVVESGKRCFQMRSVAGQAGGVGNLEVTVCPFVDTSPMLRDGQPEEAETVSCPKTASDCFQGVAAVD